MHTSDQVSLNVKVSLQPLVYSLTGAAQGLHNDSAAVTSYQGLASINTSELRVTSPPNWKSTRRKLNVGSSVKITLLLVKSKPHPNDSMTFRLLAILQSIDNRGFEALKMEAISNTWSTSPEATPFHDIPNVKKGIPFSVLLS